MNHVAALFEHPLLWIVAAVLLWLVSEETTDRDIKGIREFDERGEPEILLASFNRPRERSCQAAVMGKVLLGPFSFPAKRSNAGTKALADGGRVLHFFMKS